ncbi:hypothetical protein AAY473_008202 [Plecturocebus cupreus]
MHQHTQLIFVVLVEMGFLHVDRAGLELPTSGDPPASASQYSGITGMSHHAQLDRVTSKDQEQLGKKTPIGCPLPRKKDPSPIFVAGSHSVAQAVVQWSDLSTLQLLPPESKGGLELLTSKDPPTLASQSAGITGVGHNTQPVIISKR